MFIRDLAKILYEPNSASANMPIIVRKHCGDERILWKGAAKDLQDQIDLGDYLVVEMRVNRTNKDILPEYKKGKIITVC